MEGQEVTFSEIAALAGVTRQCVYLWVKKGLIKAEGLRGKQTISEAEWERFAAGRKARASAQVHEEAAI
jgi:predicted site-specific integrase-resolvase